MEGLLWNSCQPRSAQRCLLCSRSVSRSRSASSRSPSAKPCEHSCRGIRGGIAVVAGLGRVMLAAKSFKQGAQAISPWPRMGFDGARGAAAAGWRSPELAEPLVVRQLEAPGVGGGGMVSRAPGTRSPRLSVSRIPADPRESPGKAAGSTLLNFSAAAIAAELEGDEGHRAGQNKSKEATNRPAGPGRSGPCAVSGG